MTEPLAPPPIPATATAGLVLSERYRLDSLLAVGGMAEVWRATDLLLNRPVAVKVLHRHLASDPGFVARFRSEAVAAASLHHPGIVAVFDTCSDAGIEAIVLELVDGHTVREHLDDVGPLPAVDAIDIAAAVADSLAVAHRAGLVHRDVKPANILLGHDDRVMITDFGIAKAMDSTDKTATGTMLGSVKYLSPEQVEGATLDGRSDLFSLGVVLYEMLAGTPPWMADQPAAIALARLHTPPPPLADRRPDLPPGLDEVVRTALAVDRDRRQQSAPALRDALLAVRAGAPLDVEATVVSARPMTTPGAPIAEPTPVRSPVPAPSPRTPGPDDRAPVPGGESPPPRRRWPAALLLLLLLAAGLGVTVALVWDSNQGRDLREAAGDPTVESRPLTVSAAAYDPQGTGPPGENDAVAALAVDGDATTAWATEGYDARTFGTKDGVGLVVTLDGEHRLDRVVVTSPTTGWSAAIYVAATPAAELSGWGDPVAAADAITPDGHTFDMDGVTGGAVLVWITDLGEPAPRHKVSVAEVVVEGT